MDMEFVRNRITQLRTDKGVSEYEMSLSLDKSSNYIQSITSGRAKPSLPMLFEICEYLEISLSDFFNIKNNDPALVRKVIDDIRNLNEKDLLLVINLISRLSEHDVTKESDSLRIFKT